MVGDQAANAGERLEAHFPVRGLPRVSHKAVSLVV